MSVIQAAFSPGGHAAPGAGLAGFPPAGGPAPTAQRFPDSPRPLAVHVGAAIGAGGGLQPCLAGAARSHLAAGSLGSWPAAPRSGTASQRTPAPRASGFALQARANAVLLPGDLMGRFPVGVGQALPAPLRDGLEEFFQADLSDVRVHVGTLPRALGALAMTRGPQIQLCPGRSYDATAQGRLLLARQVCHVLQQRSGRVRNPYGSGLALVRDPRLEAEAVAAARGFVARPLPARRHASPLQGFVPGGGALRASPSALQASISPEVAARQEFNEYYNDLWEQRQDTHLPIPVDTLNDLRRNFVEQRITLTGSKGKKKRTKLQQRTKATIRSTFRRRPPPPGSESWLKSVIRRGGSLRSKDKYNALDDSWRYSYSRSYYIDDDTGAMTDYVVHVHWAGQSEKKLYMVSQSIKRRNNELGPKTGNVTRHTLDDLGLPLFANETFEQPLVDKRPVKR